MKRAFLTSLVVICCTLWAAAQPKVIAHRGYWRAAEGAQNSIASLEEAAKLGCWGSEFDVWLTADDQLILYHDNEHNGERVESLKMADFDSHRLENGEKVPLLEEFLRVAQNYPDIELIFELKPHHDKGRERKAVAASVAMVEAMGLAERTEYISFSLEACEEFHRLAPDAKVYYLNGELSAKKLACRGFAGADYHLTIYRLNPKLIAKLHKLGLEANVWTVNEEKDMEWVAEHSIDYLTTDYPEVALKLYEGK